MMPNLWTQKSFQNVRFLFLGMLVLSLVAVVWESATEHSILPQGLCASNNNSNNSSNNNSNNNNSNSSNRNGNNNNNNNSDSSLSNRDYMAWGYRSVVGGFSIDAENAFRRAAKQEIQELGQQVQASLDAIPADLDQETAQRKISLRRLNDLVNHCNESGDSVPDTARYLGGLTAIDYVVADPENNDIYLVGPAEGWTSDESGTIVGKVSGKPVLLLEDLLTVLRAWNNTKPEVISCSIDPTQDALARFARMESIPDPDTKRTANEQAMGMMTVSFSGIPADSRMATVLAAADYRMKRLSLGFDQVDLKSFPSYFSMIKTKKASAFAPRFWIEPEYSTVYHDSDLLVWNVSETKAHAMTEREYFDANGNRTISDKEDPAANRWARNMTSRYEELAKVEPIFAEVKNCMDLALIVALIRFENLPEKAGCALASLSNPEVLPTASYKQVATVPGESLVRTLGVRGDYVSVTGGISINPWVAVRDSSVLKTDLANPAETVAFAENSFWAN